MKSWHLGHHTANPYFAFTDACNDDAPRIILASGQACVWYHLTLASKDGDWIIRESNDVCHTILDRLEQMGAKYRLGAPLDIRWLRAGWSSHFETILDNGQRLRFDFVSRPPRISESQLDILWKKVENGVPAVVPPESLILLKQTMRMKDYPYIGALALGLNDPADQIRWTLEPESFLALLEKHPNLAVRLPQLRPSCSGIPRTIEATAIAMDAEIRTLRQNDEHRIRAYIKALQPWAEHFRSLEIEQLPLKDAHARIITAATGILPETKP